MSQRMDIETLHAQLAKIREVHGEEAFQKARRDLAVSLVDKPNGETFIRNAFPDLDLDDLRKQAAADRRVTESNDPDQMMLGMVKQQIPNLKTQAEFNYFMAAFDALRLTINSYLGRDLAKAEKGRAALNQALDTLRQLPDAAEKIEQIPEDQRSKQAQEFTQPAAQLHEHDTQRQLLIELAGIESGAELTNWYEKNRQSLEGIISPRLRNELFDEVRRKRNAFAAEEAN